MKIDQYCQRQRCKHVELEQFDMLSRRAGLSATAGLSCFNFNDTILCVIVVIFNTSSGIKYALSTIIDVTTTFGSIHLA